MKSVFFFSILGLCLLLLSCNASNSYEIRGKVNGTDMNGKYVYIMSLYPENSKILDSALVENSEFKWQGVADTSRIFRVCVPTIFQLAFDLQDVLVIKEGGVVKVDVTLSSSSVGTPLNDSLQQWKLEKERYDRLRLDIYKSHKEMGKYGDPSWKKELDSLKQSFVEFNDAFISNNKGNVVGRFVNEMMNSPLNKKN